MKQGKLWRWWTRCSTGDSPLVTNVSGIVMHPAGEMHRYLRTTDFGRGTRRIRNISTKKVRKKKTQRTSEPRLAKIPSERRQQHQLSCQLSLHPLQWKTTIYNHTSTTCFFMSAPVLRSAENQQLSGTRAQAHGE